MGDDVEPVWTPVEIGQMFRVDPKTVNRWIAAGRLRDDEWFRTPGGRLRVRDRAVKRMQKLEET